MYRCSQMFTAIPKVINQDLNLSNLIIYKVIRYGLIIFATYLFLYLAISNAMVFSNSVWYVYASNLQIYNSSDFYSSARYWNSLFYQQFFEEVLFISLNSYSLSLSGYLEMLCAFSDICKIIFISLIILFVIFELFWL
jgi:hypothetical protein